jgi:peptide chain release factor 1
LKPSLLNRLDQLVDRHEELSALLADQDVISDQTQFVAFSQEYSEIEPIVRLVQERRLLDADRVELESYLNGDDADMNELAESELPDIREKLESLESQLQVALVPKDPADSRSAFVEIRAGPGGDEAALFVGDLTRMYLKFAET